MAIEYWMLGGLLVALAAAFGFVVGRTTAPRERQFQALHAELEETRGELQRMRSEVNGHFEQSGRLFGALVQDYRAIYEHFVESARRLGFTPTEAEQLLRRADRDLIPGRTADPTEAETPAGTAAEGEETEGGGTDATSAGEPENGSTAEQSETGSAAEQPEAGTEEEPRAEPEDPESERPERERAAG